MIEMAGLAPVPYCGQVLGDFGAEVIRIDRAGVKHAFDRQSRGKKSIVWVNNAINTILNSSKFSLSRFIDFILSNSKLCYSHPPV